MSLTRHFIMGAWNPWVETHGYPPGPLTRSVAGVVVLQQGLLIRLIQKIMVIPDWFC